LDYSDYTNTCVSIGRHFESEKPAASKVGSFGGRGRSLRLDKEIQRSLS
jgi:hypothetical protein